MSCEFLMPEKLMLKRSEFGPVEIQADTPLSVFKSNVKKFKRENWL